MNEENEDWGQTPETPQEVGEQQETTMTQAALSNLDARTLRWMRRLGDFGKVAEMMEVTDNGSLMRNPGNVCTWLDNLHPYKGRLRFNEFTQYIELDGKPISDNDIVVIANDASVRLGFYNKATAFDAISMCANRHSYHPVKEYLAGLEWDGEPRAETFFIDRLGAEDTPLTREISAKWLYAMLKRVLEPACTFDHYLIVSDPQQGTGKSKTFERLTEPIGISGATRNNIKPDLSDKDNVMYLNNCIVGLFDESNQIKYSALEAFKTFVSTKEFTVRLPYNRTISTFPIHCVYAATTNEQTFLTDTTSSYERRAWVLLCHGNPDRTSDQWDALNSDEVIGQVWAELKHWHDNQSDAPWKIEGTAVSYLTDKNEKELRKIQEGAKTSTDDSQVINAIQTVLTQRYSKKKFPNAYEFENDHRFHYNEEEFVHALDRIPFKWFCGYVNHLIGGKASRSDKYIRQLITSGSLNYIIGEWGYDYKKYNGTRQACLYLVNPLEDDGDDTEETPEEQKTGPKISEGNTGIMPADSSPLFTMARKGGRK